jgi:hypothetical protein
MIRYEPPYEMDSTYSICRYLTGLTVAAGPGRISHVAGCALATAATRVSGSTATRHLPVSVQVALATKLVGGSGQRTGAHLTLQVYTDCKQNCAH